MEKILVLCAHPDDETLGLGGTLSLHSKNGDQVFVLFFTDGETARKKDSKDVILRKKQAIAACKILGIKKTKFLNYPDENLDTFPLLEISRHIESIITEWSPSVVYTHFWGDVNQDHKKIFEATKIATRPKPFSPIKKIICYETPSSTEWGRVPEIFNPNLFVDITSTLKKKISALQKYKNEIQPFPHPRSKKSIITRSQYWGSSVGIKNSESFILLRELS
jgi:N-acetylglucosamine malate deacetylase 1